MLDLQIFKLSVLRTKPKRIKNNNLQIKTSELPMKYNI